PDTHPTLVDGVPVWMRSSLRAWVVAEYSYRSSTTHMMVNNVERVREFDLVARGQPLVSTLAKEGPAGLFNSIDDDSILRLLDWTVFDNAAKYGGRERNAALEKILASGSSAWRVGERASVAGLERRVPDGVQAAAEAAMARPGDAGRLLSDAWHAVYGQNPQPDLGYRKSIEAVEAVVLTNVMPEDDTATLGKAIGQMRAQGDWKLPFVKEHARNPSQGVVLGMMQALWSGQSDRHPGTASYTQSTQPAAEAAVTLAVTIVNLFANGGIQRR
ncbi:MAG: hypothetical protein LH624_18095, partial [Cryobacterium sp.]|nr:hypothetical protein [Cryobacterium sp.]